MIEASLKLVEVGYFEVQFAFEGLANEHVWLRPAPVLLSIGEIAGHLAYWEAVRLAGEGDDLSKCRIASPLVDNRFRYHEATVATPPSEQHLALTAEQVHAELLRVHQESLAHFRALNPAPDARIPGCPSGFTYAEYLEYAGFHIAYHVGQMYSARHLLGDTPPDN